MKIGELAKQVGISTDSVRLYEKLGLISSVRRSNGYRDYAPVELQRVKLIKQAQTLGFTLSEINETARGAFGTTMPVSELRLILDEKIAVIETRIQQLNGLRQMLIERRAAACPLNF